MKRRIWPEIVIVLAILAIGAAGSWALWGKSWTHKDRARTVPETSAGTPMT